MNSINQLIRDHISLSGCISLTTLGLAKFFTVLGIILQFSFGIVGCAVGLITIYSFLEKKGLLPRQLRLKDKDPKK